MIFRIASLFTVAAFIKLLSISITISSVGKYYVHYVSTVVHDVIHGSETQEYDFIVVGAGSAGCVVANRLSKYNSVLLLESGGTPFYANSIPIMTRETLHRPETDYMYKTVPQKHSMQGGFEKRSYWPRGKILGGSSNLNSMVYVRGHPYDYDNWANLTQDESWNYKNLLEHFKKSINYNGYFSKDDHNHGYLYGTQNVEAHHEKGPFHKLFMDAGKEMGFDVDIDLNGPQRSGFGPGEVNQKQGKRETSYTAFIEPILDRDNLHVSIYSRAVKLQMDKSNKVVGVWYVQHGKRRLAKARKEVIVSAGSVDSPKLLLLSGIGPTKHLQEVNIKPKIDLPVGKNLKDHLQTFLVPFSINSTIHSFQPERDLGISNIFEYYWKGTGPVSKTVGNIAISFFTSSLTKRTTGLDWPDFQIVICGISPYRGIDSEMSYYLKLKQDMFQRLYGNAIEEGKDGFMMVLTLGRVKSTGMITLKSKDPSEDPVIDPNYLSHPDDISRYVEAVKFSMKLVEETKAFQEINSTYANVPIDDCRHHVFRSDKYWECYLRMSAVTMYHAVSTNRMGGPNDTNSVVDSQLRVRQTRGLRIVDCSIFPELISGNINAAAVVVGEKGGSIIRTHWAQQYSVCVKMEMLSKSWSHHSKCFYSRFA